MAKQGISTGTTPNDGTGDSLLDGALKINANFTEIYEALGDGSTIGSYASFTGVVTATSFDGELTGVAVTSYSGGLTVTGVTTSSGGFVGGLTGNVTGTATTATVALNAQGLTGNPSITVGNINVGTAITIGSGNTQTTNSIELTGTIDSVSIITDRLNSGIATFTENVYLGDSDHLYFGGGNDLDIYHSGTDNFIVGSTGVIHLRNNDIKIQSGAGNTEYARFRDVGVELYQGTYKKFETTSAGVLISGGIEATGISTFSDDVNFIGQNYDAYWDQSLYQGCLKFEDNASLVFGTSDDFRIYYSDFSTKFDGTALLSGGLSVRTGAGQTIAHFGNWSGVGQNAELYYDGIKKFETTSAGVLISGGIEATGISTFQSTVSVAGTSIFLGSNEAPVIQTDITGITTGVQIRNIISLPQGSYDAIVSPDPNTYYIITP